MRRQAAAIALFATWEWITVAGTRLVVEQSYWSLPLAAITTVLWVYGVRVSVEKQINVVVIIVGVVLGTWLGIKIP